YNLTLYTKIFQYFFKNSSILRKRAFTHTGCLISVWRFSQKFNWWQFKIIRNFTKQQACLLCTWAHSLTFVNLWCPSSCFLKNCRIFSLGVFWFVFFDWLFTDQESKETFNWCKYFLKELFSFSRP